MGEKISRKGFAVALILLLSLVTVVSITPTIANGWIKISGKFEYIDEFGVNQPMRQVKVRLMDNDTWECSSVDEEVAVQYTGDDGSYSFTVENDDGVEGPLQTGPGRDPYIIVESSNIAADVKSPSQVTYRLTLPMAGYNVPDGFDYDYGTVTPVSRNEAWQVLDAVLSVRNWIWGQVSWERPSKVAIIWPSGRYPLSSGDRIDLPDRSRWAWDRLNIYHLYGLSVLYTLYGNRFPSGWKALPPHAVYLETNRTIAFVEGWAGFLQAAVDNNPDNLEGWHLGHGGNIETNDWFNCIDMGDMDGDIVEGSIASVFWDVWDPANEPFDHLSLGFDEIFYIVRDYRSANFNAFWSSWRSRYPLSIGDLTTIAWMYGIDKDVFPPTGSILINSGDTYTTSRDVTLTISASDYGSGVASMRFTNRAAWPWGWSGWYLYTTSMGWTLTNGDGVKTVTAQFRDVKGLITKSPFPMDTIILDTVPPTGSIAINSDAKYTTIQSVTLTLTYLDATSGVWRVRYSNDGVWDTEPWEAPPPAGTKAWNLLPGDGPKTVYYQIQDNAGWISSSYVDTIILDSTAPTGSIIINAGATYTNSPTVTLTLTYADALSGVKQVKYSNDGTAWTLWEPPAPTRTWTLTFPDGWKTVYYQIEDNAGNPSIIYSDGIGLDTTAPTTTATHSNPSDYVYLTGLDLFSGVAVTKYRIDYGPWWTYAGSITLPSPSPYTHVVDYYSVDYAGNQEDMKTFKVHYLTVETNVPEVTPVNHPSSTEGWYTQGVTVWVLSSTTGAPDTYWVGTTMFGFQTWKVDTKAVSGNPIGIVMSGPHVARAGYLGMEFTKTGQSGTTLYLSIRMRSEVTKSYQFKIRVEGPVTMELDAGSMTVLGPADMTMSYEYTFSGLTSGSYTVYFKFYDPTTASLRAQSQITFTAP